LNYKNGKATAKTE